MSVGVVLIDSATGNPIAFTGGAMPITVLPTLISTSTLSNVASSAASVTVLALNTARKGVIIFNDSTAVLRVKFGATASATSFTHKSFAGDAMVIDSTQLYTGVIDGIWESADGFARVTELS